MSDPANPQLAEGALSATTEELTKWFVFRTKSRQEKALASALSTMGTEHFLPLVTRVRFYQRRKTTVELPLFPGYLFVCGTPEEAYDADRTGRVAQILTIADQEQIVWELQNLRRALSHNVPMIPGFYIPEGIRVEVRDGPLRGLQGVVQRRNKQDRLTLQVDAFGGAASLEVDASLLERIS